MVSRIAGSRVVAVAIGLATLVPVLGAGTASAAVTPSGPPSAGPADPSTALTAQRLRDARAQREDAASDTQVVVRYAAAATAGQRGAAERSVAVRSSRSVPGLGVDLLEVADAQRAVERLSATPGVVYAERLVFAKRLNADPALAPERVELGVEAGYVADSRMRGAGQVVAVIDDGVDGSNVDLRGRVDDGGYFDAAGVRSAGGVFSAPQTGNPHGTAVAAVTAAAQNGQGIQGVAPEARIRSYRVFPLGGNGASSAAVATAIRTAADESATTGVRVANLSLGFSLDSRLVREAVAYARQTAPQLLLVVAAGNDAGLRASYPAGYAGVLSVGASGDTDRNGAWTQTGFSTKGDVDVLAPGQAVSSWYPDSTGTVAVRPISGTSFAAPAVAGIAAGLAATGVTGRTAATAIKASAEPANTTAEPLPGNGSGRADAARALALASGSAAYSAAFVHGGSILGSVTDRRSYEAIRVSRSAAAGPPTVTASTGQLVPTSTSTLEPGVDVATGTYLPPATDSQALRNASLRAAGAGETGDVTPLGLVPATAGNIGTPATDRARYSMRSYSKVDGSGYAYDLYTVSAHLTAGQRYSVTATYPSDSSPPVIYSPPTVSSTASVTQEEWAFLDELSGCETAFGKGTHTCTQTAPKTGRYAFSFVNVADAATYTMSLDYVTPSASVAVPAVLSSVRTTPSVPVTWKGTATGLLYDVDYLVRHQSTATNGVWKRWRTRTSATSATFGGSYGGSYLFRVRAVAPNGNTSAWGAVRRSVSPYDERTGYAAYSTGWTTSDAAGRWSTGVRQSRSAGRSATVQAKGFAFAVIGDRCAACGRMKIYVDGVYRTTVDSYASSTRLRQVLWSSGTLSGGSGKSHSVKVVVVGTSGRPTVRLDGFAVSR